MTRAVEWSLSVVAGAAFGTVWLVAVIAAGISNFPSWQGLLAFWSIVIVPGVLAARVLIRRVRLTGDGPDRLFTVAAGLMPAHREDWVAAMRAELTHVPGNAARWAFAAGCVRAALAPRAGLAPVTAAALAGVTAAYTLPAITVFAMTFVGVLVLTTPASSPRVPTVAGLAGLAGLLGVAAGVITMAYLVFTYPSMGTALRPRTAIILALVLAGYARLALAPPRALMGTHTVRTVGVLTAAMVSVGIALVSHLPGGSGVMGYVAFPPVALFLVGAAVAAIARSFRAGALAATWTILLSTTWVFVLWLVESAHWYGNDIGPFGFGGARGLVWVATWLPVWALPIGLLGAAAGAWVRRRRPTY
jgi:hypothetical protein